MLLTKEVCYNETVKTGENNMEKETAKVLHVFARLHDGGVERMLMNYYERMNRDKIHFDFVIHTQEKDLLEDSAIDLGVNVFHLQPKTKGLIRYFFALGRVIKEGRYDVVQSHQGPRAWYPLFIAKVHGVPKRIAHCHVEMIPYNRRVALRNRIEAFLTMKMATELYACSKEAGSIWGKHEFVIIPDAVDIEKMSFSPDIRETKRKELGVSDLFFAGCVSRFVDRKNHVRTLEIFEKLQKKYLDTALGFVGTGPLEESIKNLVKEKGLKNVFFFGERENVNEFLNAFDVFILPTKMEGFGMVILEAELNRLRTVISDVVPPLVCISDKCKMLSLLAPDEEWVQALEEAMKEKRDEVSFNQNLDFFDINKQTDFLSELYLAKPIEKTELQRALNNFLK